MPGRTMNVFSAELMDALEALIDPRRDRRRGAQLSSSPRASRASSPAPTWLMVRGYIDEARNASRATRCSSAAAGSAACSSASRRRQALGRRGQRHRARRRPRAGAGLPRAPRRRRSAHPARRARGAMGPAAGRRWHAATAAAGRLRTGARSAADGPLDRSGDGGRLGIFAGAVACRSPARRREGDRPQPAGQPYDARAKFARLGRADVPPHEAARRARSRVGMASATTTSTAIRPTARSSTACSRARAAARRGDGGRDGAVPATDVQPGRRPHGAHAVPRTAACRARTGRAGRCGHRARGSARSAPRSAPGRRRWRSVGSRAGRYRVAGRHAGLVEPGRPASVRWPARRRDAGRERHLGRPVERSVGRGRGGACRGRSRRAAVLPAPVRPGPYGRVVEIVGADAARARGRRARAAPARCRGAHRAGQRAASGCAACARRTGRHGADRGAQPGAGDRRSSTSRPAWPASPRHGAADR